MRKRFRKAIKAKKTYNLGILTDASMVNDFEKRDAQLLIRRYKNNKSIVEHLCEISTHAGTYEFLGMLFFKFAVQELQHDPPAQSRIQQLKSIQVEIMELYELARAAKALRLQKQQLKKGDKPG